MVESETVERHRSAFTRDWSKQLGALAAEGSEREPWPEPEVPAREARSDEIPGPAKKLIQAAEANGWRVRVLYSRGTSQVGRSDAPEHGPVVDAVSVQCQREDQACLGYWRRPTPIPPMKAKWAWAFGLVTSRTHGPWRIGARELRDVLSDEDRGVDPSDGDTVE